MDNAYVGELLLDGEVQTHTFPEEVSYFVVENEGTQDIEVYLKKNASEYNTTPRTIPPRSDPVTFDIATSSVKVNSISSKAIITGVKRESTTTVAQIFPTYAVLWHDESVVLSGPAFYLNQGDVQKYAFWIHQNTGTAIGNRFQTMPFLLKAGTYTLTGLGKAGPTRGIVKWILVNSEGTETDTSQTQDWYAASGDNNAERTSTITIPEDGEYSLIGETVGKHASATDYRIPLTKMWFKDSS